VKRRAFITALFGISFAIGMVSGALEPAARADSPPYYVKTGTNVNSTTLTFNAMQGQGTCYLQIVATGGANTTINSVSIGALPGGSKLYDGNGNLIGTSFSTTGVQAVLFPCTNSVGVSVSVTPALTYSYTFIATRQAWPFGSSAAAAGASPCPTAQSDGGCLTHQLNTEVGWGAAMTPTVTVLVTNVTNVVYTCGTTVGINCYIWGIVVTATGANAGTLAQLVTGGSATCGGSQVTWTGGVTVPASAGSTLSLWGNGTNSGAFGAAESFVPIQLPGAATANQACVKINNSAVNATAYVFASVLPY
jgi:hypothetical protein